MVTVDAEAAASAVAVVEGKIFISLFIFLSDLFKIWRFMFFLWVLILLEFLDTLLAELFKTWYFLCFPFNMHEFRIFFGEIFCVLNVSSSGCWCNFCFWCSCKMYPDMSYTESTTTETLIMGVAPVKAQFEGAEMGVAAAENGGCKCGSNCTCDPCTCKWSADGSLKQRSASPL